MLEIALATLNNMKDLAIAVCFVALFPSLIMGINYMVDKDFADTLSSSKRSVDMAKKWFKFLIPIYLIFLPLTIIPSLDDLWKVRIALIKYKLANPENLSKATDTIERIGRKLECKYLSCKEEEKK